MAKISGIQRTYKHSLDAIPVHYLECRQNLPWKLTDAHACLVPRPVIEHDDGELNDNTHLVEWLEFSVSSFKVVITNRMGRRVSKFPRPGNFLTHRLGQFPPVPTLAEH